VDTLKSGTSIGEYQIAQPIGEGAIAKIYRARQLKLDRDVAIKILDSRDEWDDDVVELFEQEAKTIARLSHPNIVHVIDCGMHERRYYFVLEYVDGTDFKVILKEDLCDLSQKLDAIIQTLRALEYAHNNGIVHRDIKPANLLVSSAGHVKVADFGMALVTDRKDMTDTDSVNVVGTPAYMAPEQWNEDRNVDCRADLYSVGVMLYEVLTRKRSRSANPAPPSSICSDVSNEMDAVVLNCLEEEPERRYQTASELKGDLLAVISGPSENGTKSAGDLSRKAEISISNKYVHLDTLNESQFGATYLVKNTRDNSLYVVKKICRDTSGVKEARRLAQLRHPNVLRVYGAGVDAKKGILVTEYAHGGSLADRLVNPYPRDEAMEIFCQMASGLSFAHNNGIIHGNLRPSNVLFNNANRVKLADFALPEHYLRRRDNWYGAPERERSVAADIYSAGIILYQLLTSKTPDIRSGGELAWTAKSRNGRFTILNLISQMLERDPSKRPTSVDGILKVCNNVFQRAESGKKGEPKEGAAVSSQP